MLIKISYKQKKDTTALLCNKFIKKGKIIKSKKKVKKVFDTPISIIESVGE